MEKPPVPASYRDRDKMTLEEFIADVEECHFRTAHDTGANLNAMFVWNIVRNWAGMDSLDIDDLHRNHARIDNKTYEEVKADYDRYEAWKGEQRR